MPDEWTSFRPVPEDLERSEGEVGAIPKIQTELHRRRAAKHAAGHRDRT